MACRSNGNLRFLIKSQQIFYRFDDQSRLCQQIKNRWKQKATEVNRHLEYKKKVPQSAFLRSMLDLLLIKVSLLLWREKERKNWTLMRFSTFFCQKLFRITKQQSEEKSMGFARAHSVWKSQKKSHSTLRAKRATFTFWVDKS